LPLPPLPSGAASGGFATGAAVLALPHQYPAVSAPAIRTATMIDLAIGFIGFIGFIRYELFSLKMIRVVYRGGLPASKSISASALL
jgi:hypothetical protein